MNIKVCGHQSLQDIKMTLQTEVTHFGFVFAQSKRCVKASDVGEWLRDVDVDNRTLVGVFVNASFEEIANVLRLVPLDVIQCHGSESAAYTLTLKQLTGCTVWKAIHHQNGSLQSMKDYEGSVDGYVIDASVSGRWGGTGQSFSWEDIPSYTEEANRQGVACFIAGGINVDTIDELLTHEPPAIDLASGSETSGAKDREKIMRIEERVKEYVAVRA